MVYCCYYWETYPKEWHVTIAGVHTAYMETITVPWQLPKYVLAAKYVHHQDQNLLPAVSSSEKLEEGQKKGFTCATPPEWLPTHSASEFVIACSMHPKPQTPLLAAEPKGKISVLPEGEGGGVCGWDEMSLQEGGRHWCCVLLQLVSVAASVAAAVLEIRGHWITHNPPDDKHLSPAISLLHPPLQKLIQIPQFTPTTTQPVTSLPLPTATLF